MRRHDVENVVPAAGELPITHHLISVEQSFGVRLPASYKGFLLSQHSRARSIPGLVLDCHRLWSSREAARHVLRDSSARFSLKQSDFVFLLDHDHRFFFFRCDQGDDPPVFRFLEGQSWPRQLAASFTAWLQQVAPTPAHLQ